MICVPTSLDQEIGEGLGAQAGQTRFTQVIREGGVSRIRIQCARGKDYEAERSNEETFSTVSAGTQNDVAQLTHGPKESVQ